MHSHLSRLAVAGFTAGMMLGQGSSSTHAQTPEPRSGSELVGYEPTAIYDAAWQIVGERFFDPAMNGVNWEAAGARHRVAARAARTSWQATDAINALLEELNTSHMGHYTPMTVEYYHLLAIFEGGPAEALRNRRFPEGVRYEGIEAWLKPEGQSLFITGIWPGGNADEAGLLLGDEIVTINGKPPTPIGSFRGRAGERVVLQIRRVSNGDLQEVGLSVRWIEPKSALMDAMRTSARVINHEDVRIGYVQILSYAGPDYHQLLLGIIFGHEFADADALLIDLRGGWGGASPDYLQPFLPGPMLTMQPRDQPRTSWPQKWRKPVGLLVDEGSRSGKEVLTHGFRTYKLGPVIGERTAGALVAGSVAPLPDDSILYLAIADVLCDGERLEGKGVEPDVEVPFDPRYAQGADPQLLAGVRAMAEQVKSGR